MTLLEHLEAARGRPAGQVALGATAVGVLAFASGVGLGQARTVLAALDASWLFFAGLSAGSVAVAAAVRISHGRWARPVLPIAESATAFFLPAVALLAVLLAGARALVPGAGTATLALRQLVPSLALFALGWRLVERARQPGADERKVLSAAVVYLLAYVVALSLWAIDWVMALSSAPPPTVLPAIYFFGAFLSGLAWVALLAAWRGTSGPDLRHDLGKLLFALIVVWSYLLWALFLATWYGNLPDEVEPMLRRWEGPYRPVTVAVLVAVFVWPFWLLFSERLKRHRVTLAIGAGAVLLGLWAERFLLVLPALDLAGDASSVLVGGGVAVGVSGLFFLSVWPRLASLGVAEGSSPTAPREGALYDALSENDSASPE